MMSIVAPAIEAEVNYRHERIAEDFRRARKHRSARREHTPAAGHRTRSTVTASHA
ncbi:MAG TPA: hypothetical protein VK585_01540 [Jiangellaceae bacterium]|nr:hypothetical protein [Jiangellaceae bacterium]